MLPVRAALAMTFVAAATALLATAQSPAAPAAAFDAISITPSDGRRGIDLRYLEGRMVATAVTLRQLICEAYGIDQRQLTGGADWLNADMFDVVGTSPGNASRDRMRPMLQAAITERFKLVIAREPRTSTVYTLTASTVKNLKPPANPTEKSLVRLIRNDDRANGHLSFAYEGHNATIAALADAVSGQLRSAVTDATGIKGNYDFRVAYTLDSAYGGLEPDPNIPTIFTALQNELGLKLVAGRGSVEMYVVRSAAKLEPN